MQRCSLVFLVLGLLVVCPTAADAGYLEVTAGAGTALLDVEELVLRDESSSAFANDWSQARAGVSVRYFLSRRHSLTFGAELGYDYLYWYEVNLDQDFGSNFREYNVTAVRAAGLIRVLNDRPVSIDFGAGVHFFETTEPSLTGALTWTVPLRGGSELPIRVRVDGFDYIVPTAVLTFSIGFRFNIGS